MVSGAEPEGALGTWSARQSPSGGGHSGREVCLREDGALNCDRHGCGPDAPPKGPAHRPPRPSPTGPQGAEAAPASAALGLSVPRGRDLAQGPAQTRRLAGVVSEDSGRQRRLSRPSARQAHAVRPRPVPARASGQRRASLPDAQRR